MYCHMYFASIRFRIHVRLMATYWLVSSIVFTIKGCILHMRVAFHDCEISRDDVQSRVVVVKMGQQHHNVPPLFLSIYKELPF